MKTWQRTEDLIRKIAKAKWNTECNKMNIAGVEIDGVVIIDNESYVLIEMTENNTLSKVREDILKLRLAKNKLKDDDIIAKCYIVINGNVTPTMIETGKASKINVMSIEDFINEIIGYNDYITNRKDRPFGSCINIGDTISEKVEYIPVKYEEYIVRKDDQSSNKKPKRKFVLKKKCDIFIDRIFELLHSQKKVILLGEFGTGKSRCIKELFQQFTTNAQVDRKYPIAINLRDCGGLKDAEEIFRRHYNNLGLSSKVDSIIKLWKNENFTIFLDGFDEVSTQIWSENKETLKNIRHESLAAIRSIIQEANGSVLICGREHYFSSTDEMIELLGINEKNVVILKCRQEFDDIEFDEYLHATGQIEAPSWLPRRPLICNILANLPQEDVHRLLSEETGEIEFFDSYIDIVCRREANMFPQIEYSSLKNILMRLARYTRSKPNDVGPITAAEIRASFEEVLSGCPIDDASVILQRLVGLGRYESESEDRSFADSYILDGLRAMDVVNIIDSQTYEVFDQHWINPLRLFGVKFIANKFAILGSEYIKILLKKNQLKRNTVLLSDIFSANNILSPGDSYDDLIISNSYIDVLDISKLIPKNITFNQCYFNEVYLGNRSVSDFYIKNSIIEKAIGADNPQEIPSWVIDTSISEYVGVSVIADIKNSQLSDNHKVFLVIIRKTFFQPGAGRKEEALMRGLGAGARNAKVNKILNLLMRKNILTSFKGDEGFVYRANRQHMDRMKSLMEAREASTDELWELIGKL